MFTIYATNYAPVDPLTPPCDISLMPIGYKGEDKARCVVFDLTDCVDNLGDGTFEISFIRDGDTQPYIVTNTDRLDNNAIWEVDATDTAVAGYGLVQLMYFVNGVVCKTAQYRTVTFNSNGSAGDAPDPYENLLDQIAAYAAQAQASARSAAQSAASAKDYADHIADPVAGLVTDWLEENITQETGYVLDDSLTVEGAAADAKAVGDALKTEQENLTAGNALQLASNNYTEDSVPYVYRTTGGGVDVGDREFDELVGGTVAWNQNVYNGNFISGGGWTTSGDASVSNNVITTTATSANNYYLYPTAGYRFEDKQNRVLFCRYDWQTNNTKTFKIAIGGSINSNVVTAHGVDTYTANTWYTDERIVKPDTASANQLRIGQLNNIAIGNSFSVKNAMVVDLTQMFGSTIADYLLTLETGTAGAGVAKLKEWGYFTEDYYAYDAGSLQSVNASKHVTRDSNDNIIGEYALDSSLTLRGIPKLDADNKLYYDGDTYSHDGSVVRRFAAVDLGTLSWTKHSTDPSTFYADVTGMLTASEYSLANILCAKYRAVKRADQSTTPSDNDKTISARTSGGYHRLFVIDTTYADSDAPAFKTAMSGVYLVYQLITETTATADPFQYPQICADGGTEEYVDAGVTASTPTRDVSIPVGHVTRYPTDQVKKLDGLPANFSTLIAPVEKTFTATQNYTVGSYVIVNNQLYKVTSAIANGGTITPNTNVTATTIMAEILSL